MRSTWLIMLVASAACAGKPVPPGSACNSNGDCRPFQCLELDADPGDGGCVAIGRSCSQTCTTDADCAGLRPGFNFQCATSCAGTPYCRLVP